MVPGRMRTLILAMAIPVLCRKAVTTCVPGTTLIKPPIPLNIGRADIQTGEAVGKVEPSPSGKAPLDRHRSPVDARADAFRGAPQAVSRQENHAAERRILLSTACCHHQDAEISRGNERDNARPVVVDWRIHEEEERWIGGGRGGGQDLDEPGEPRLDNQGHGSRRVGRQRPRGGSGARCIELGTSGCLYVGGDRFGLDGRIMQNECESWIGLRDRLAGHVSEAAPGGRSRPRSGRHWSRRHRSRWKHRGPRGSSIPPAPSPPAPRGTRTHTWSPKSQVYPGNLAQSPSVRHCSFLVLAMSEHEKATLANATCNRETNERFAVHAVEAFSARLFRQGKGFVEPTSHARPRAA